MNTIRINLKDIRENLNNVSYKSIIEEFEKNNYIVIDDDIDVSFGLPLLESYDNILPLYVKDIISSASIYDANGYIPDSFGHTRKNSLIKEGLIRTYPLKSLFRNLIIRGFDKRGLKGRPIKSKEGHESGYFSFNGEEGINEFKEICNAFGWFISKMEKENNIISVIIEPKFDITLSKDELPPKLYHVTKSKFIDRISKQGLTPRSTNKVTTAPDRVYLLLNKPNDWKKQAEYYRELMGDKDDYSLLEIDTKGIFNNSEIYKDPNSNYETACFVLEPISPLYIKVIDNE